jgi:16S rRNA (cytidine1402-2'-O)-methyltransferase
MVGTLYIVATPIGNLLDITFRAIKTLESVDLILCEDTRVTKKVLTRYNIDTKTISYHQHSTDKKVAYIKRFLQEGRNLALVTDAGTPGISDPGNRLIADLRLKIEELEIIPIPGASAIITALSLSGFPTDKFTFMGFPPHKKRRKQFFQEVAEVKYTVAFYESSHRIKKALQELKEVLKKDAKVCVCRELTKKFESIYRGSIEDILNQGIREKGEFVVVVAK